MQHLVADLLAEVEETEKETHLSVELNIMLSRELEERL